MKNSELKSLTKEELEKKLIAEKEHLSKLRFAHAISPIENPTKLREVRRLVARIATILKQRELQNTES